MSFSVANGRVPAVDTPVLSPTEMTDNRFGGTGYQLMMSNIGEEAQTISMKLRIGSKKATARYLPSIHLQPGHTAVVHGLAVGAGDELILCTDKEDSVDYVLTPGGSLNFDITIYDPSGAQAK